MAWVISHRTNKANTLAAVSSCRGCRDGAPTLQEATNAIAQAVDEFIAERKAAGEDLPMPLIDRQCSGKFVVRISPAPHARLVVEAADQNVSMNQWVVPKLSESLGRPTLRDLFDLD